MAVLDIPRHEAEEVGRLERRVQAQLFLDMLQGAFESAWDRPEDLQRALAELPSTAEGEERRRVLLSYLKAMSGCLGDVTEMGEGEVVAGAAAQGRRKRRNKARRQGPGSDSDQEKSGTETNAGSEVAAPMIEPTRGETAVSRAKEGRREGGATRVLTDDLLGCVIGFLPGPTARQRVKALGQVGSVCRTWRDMTCLEQRWAEIGAEVMPLSQKDDGQSTRSRLLQNGRMLVAERRVWRYNSWENAMWLQFEVFDARDGLQLLSARGQLWTDLHDSGYLLEILDRTLELQSTPFSAASRGYDNLRDYVSHFWANSDEPAGLCVRVTIGERATGRKALLWEDGLRVERRCVEWGDGGFSIESKSDTVVQSTGADVKMKCSTRIILWPEDNQEGVDARDKLYRVCGAEDGYDNGSAPLRVVVTCKDPYDQVPSLIMSLLRD